MSRANNTVWHRHLINVCCIKNDDKQEYLEIGMIKDTENCSEKSWEPETKSKLGYEN